MKRIKEFLVGFEGKEQTALYSNYAWSHPEGDGGVQKMTFAQAKKEAKKLKSRKVRVVIFKVIPFDVL
ncbi:MAG: hypothetical protein A3J39_08475 [Sulfuricurvum sp. RIFCSPHIGHO2_12_FULL_44_8]|nr:MAG: hypothetical protein A3J39_08475 [Sulfuricurvum sp. RIFCSPHIGHO2_12_FULL_44_8]